MFRKIARHLVFLLIVLGSSAGAGFAGPRARKDLTALDRYVFRPDSNYRFELAGTLPGQGFTTYMLDLTSQQWRTSEEVNQPVWKHWLVVVKPDQVRTPTGFLFISGGSTSSRPPRSANAAFQMLALSSGAVVAELRSVPNQPLTFRAEGRARSEDALIAYSWDKYLRGGDDDWPLRLPMTKSAVRAMDAVTAWCASLQPTVKVDRFVVAGGSKRGWTTWTTAAVDDRVIAIIPFVIDVLNVEKSLRHHYQAYGFWAPAIGDYTEMKISDWFGTARLRELLKIEDPYSYRKRLTMPKYIVNSTGDQYFTPDSWQFYYNSLPGEKYLRYVPNTKHDVENSDAPFGLMAFFESVVSGRPRPRFDWKFEKDGAIVVRAQDKPSEVRLWQALNPKARDFRLEIIGPAYKSTVLQPEKNGSYVGKASAPAQGWTAYFVEMTFPSGGKNPLKFTTGVRVLPDRLPGALPPVVKKN